MKAISVTGTHHTGKTTVCEQIIGGLRKRGYRVGSIKEIHFEAFEIDPDPTTNTRRHKAAGAQLVTARGIHETDVLYPSKLPILEILAHYDHDYVVMEGVNDALVPGIVTAITEEDLIGKVSERTIAVSGIIANDGIDQVGGLPVIHALEETEKLVDLAESMAMEPLPDMDPECCEACGVDCKTLLIDIIRGKRRREDCVLDQASTELLVGGASVVMVPFVQQILKNAVIGVAKELDGYQEGAEITVRIKP